ncbi:MAG: type II CRISPR-associated endonuclease Cas1, partial [Stenotrophobium sp.]
MIGRIVEIAQDKRFLSLDRGFLVVSSEGNEVGRVPIDDIAAVIGNAHGITFTNNVLVALAERKAPLVVCGANHHPTAVLWPLEGNFEQAGRMDAQLEAGKPLQKRLWAEIVKSKLAQQSSVLESLGKLFAPVKALIAKVRSGDPENIEAQGARRYWPLLLGEAFRRDRDADGVNALLNYGYTVLR